MRTLCWANSWCYITCRILKTSSPAWCCRNKPQHGVLGLQYGIGSPINTATAVCSHPREYLVRRLVSGGRRRAYSVVVMQDLWQAEGLHKPAQQPHTNASSLSITCCRTNQPTQYAVHNNRPIEVEGVYFTSAAIDTRSMCSRLWQQQRQWHLCCPKVNT
jgi:hypothetical protein